jgi:hypothetical protein
MGNSHSRARPTAETAAIPIPQYLFDNPDAARIVVIMTIPNARSNRSGRRSRDPIAPQCIPSLHIQFANNDKTLLIGEFEVSQSIWQPLYGPNVIKREADLDLLQPIIPGVMEYDYRIIDVARKYPGSAFVKVYALDATQAPRIEIGAGRGSDQYSITVQIIKDPEWIKVYSNTLTVLGPAQKPPTPSGPSQPPVLWTPPASSSIQLPNTNVLIAAGGAVILLFLLLLRR